MREHRGPDHDVVRDLGVGLEHSPELTELRLASRVGCANWFVLGFFGVFILLAWGAFVAAALSERQGLIGVLVLISVVAVLLLFGLYQVMRMSSGAKLSVTPDRLVVKKHWANGGESLELYLSQVRFLETGREIIVTDGRKRLKIGSALKPEARRAVVEFLTEVIAGHLHPDGGNVRVASGSGDLATARDSSTSREGQMATEPLTGERPDPDGLDTLALALCLRFRDCDPNQAHLAPAIPQAVLVAALQSYLDLQDDEVLLAIVGVGKTGSAGQGCALTTNRVYWYGKAEKSPGPRLPRCRSMPYSSLPEKIRRAGLASWAVDLGEGQRIELTNMSVQEALIAFLGEIRPLARSEASVSEISESERATARWAWPRVAAANAETRALQAEIRAFQSRTHMVSRAVVTPVLVLSCVAIYAAMVATGVSAFNPAPPMVLAWGASFGPSVVYDHQAWRLFTCMFLHFGLVHLLMNMYCLATAGPLVERFFGHLGFAALYVLSGLGGSIASLWVHPTYIGAGASGAIFGIFGGLLGYLAVRHREVPLALLKPMRNGAVAFIGYNMLFGLGIPGIDMAAHLGGLVSGFFCGLLLTAVTPAHARNVGGLAPVLRRSAVVTVLAAALAGLGLKAIDFARAGILADPQMGPLLESRLNAAPAWNAFSDASRPVFLEFDRIALGMDQVTADLERGGVPPARITQMLDRLTAECKALGARIATIPAENEEIQAIRNHLTTAQSLELQRLTSIDQFVATGDEAHINGPRGLSATTAAYRKEFQTISSLRDAYFKTHGLQVIPKAP